MVEWVVVCQRKFLNAFGRNEAAKKQIRDGKATEDCRSILGLLVALPDDGADDVVVFVLVIDTGDTGIARVSNPVQKRDGSTQVFIMLKGDGQVDCHGSVLCFYNFFHISIFYALNYRCLPALLLPLPLYNDMSYGIVQDFNRLFPI